MMLLSVQIGKDVQLQDAYLHGKNVGSKELAMTEVREEEGHMILRVIC